MPVAATAALVILGCGESSSGTSGPSPPSGAPDEVVVRVVTDGGFAAESREPARLPEVSVFGDGRVITQGPTTLEYPGPALPNLQEFRLTRDGVAAIVDEARAAGLLDDPPPDYGDAGITDQATTTVTLRVDGTKAEVQVYTLSFDDGLTVEQRENRRELQQFIGFVGHAHGVGVHVIPGSTRRYEPEALAVRVESFLSDLKAALMRCRRMGAQCTKLEPPSGDPMRHYSRTTYDELHEGVKVLQADLKTEERRWPLGDLAGTECAVFHGAELAAVLDAADGARGDVRWLSGNDSYRLVFRPLLPDEQTCDDVG